MHEEVLTWAQLLNKIRIINSVEDIDRFNICCLDRKNVLRVLYWSKVQKPECYCWQSLYFKVNSIFEGYCSLAIWWFKSFLRNMRKKNMRKLPMKRTEKVIFTATVPISPSHGIEKQELFRARTNSLWELSCSISQIWRNSSLISSKRKWRFPKKNMFLWSTICRILSSLLTETANFYNFYYRDPKKEIESTMSKCNQFDQ